MRPISDIELTEKGYCLSKRHDHWLTEDQETVLYRGQPFKLQQWTPGIAIESLSAAPTYITEDVSMNVVMEIRYHTDHSVYICDQEQISGVIRDKELYHALLGKIMLDD
jgi:glycine betaine/proline transport system ATP-binding protein